MFNEAEGRDKWLLAKRGKFGASEDYKLMVDAKGAMFSKGAWTYIEEKFLEVCTDLWENPKMEFVEPILWGNRYELPAYQHYCEATRLFDMQYHGTENPVFLEHNKDSGGSPDGTLKENGKILCGLEVKCPFTSARHYFYSKLKDQYGLKDNMIPYYVQCQKLLFITGADVWHWVSFDDRFKDKRKKMKLIEIYPEKKYQELMEIQVMQAVKERDRMIEEFLNN